ncbi:hypothetical protein [Roseibium suaedae]|uniref:Capsular polysaccharide transport system permease protein n=1 Tax=Roseibium suaedae TaxID=735517 RepID=A0A1M7P6L6_9HYPH|nr:hypothetical protein [Roseibium suaedae]SHN12289.1 capsular polysaccharide transport system permease protein [Roseibium suaedae]
MSQKKQVANQTDNAVVVRSQKMAAALSSYARHLTFENRSRRNLYRLAGLAPKMRDKVFEKLLIGAFIFCFLIPFAWSVFHYTIYVSPQYASEVRFVVRSATPLLTRNRFAGGAVSLKDKIVQDTQVVVNYLNSPEFVRDLDKEISLNSVFGRDGIDGFSRIDPEASWEKHVKYWERHLSSSINPKSGIVELTVYAFSPEEATQIMNVVLKLAEQRINTMNGDIWSNLLAGAEKGVETASARLETLRRAVQDTQNKTGVFDIGLAAESLGTVLTKLETEIADLNIRKDSLSKSLEPDSPTLVNIDRQIAARKIQVQVLRDKTAGGDGGKDQNLAEYSKQFEQLELDQKIAEEQFTAAVEDLEKIKLVSTLQLVYLDKFTEPTLADESSYPDIPLSLFLSLLGCLTAWGVASGLIVLLRHKLD